jgi:hypothetical protein
MTRLHLTALVAAVAVGAAAPLAAQDTSAAQRTPPDTSGYQGGAGVDTMMGGAADTAGMSRKAADTTAPDTTKPGDKSTRKPRHHERRMHPGSDTAGAARDSSARSDTSGMPGRHTGDSTAPGSSANPNGDRASSSDSGSNGRTESAGGAVPPPSGTGSAGQSSDSSR